MSKLEELAKWWESVRELYNRSNYRVRASLNIAELLLRQKSLFVDPKRSFEIVDPSKYNKKELAKAIAKLPRTEWTLLYQAHVNNFTNLKKIFVRRDYGTAHTVKFSFYNKQFDVISLVERRNGKGGKITNLGTPNPPLREATKRELGGVGEYNIRKIKEYEKIMKIDSSLALKYLERIFESNFITFLNTLNEEYEDLLDELDLKVDEESEYGDKSKDSNQFVNWRKLFGKCKILTREIKHEFEKINPNETFIRNVLKWNIDAVNKIAEDTSKWIDNENKKYDDAESAQMLFDKLRPQLNTIISKNETAKSKWEIYEKSIGGAEKYYKKELKERLKMRNGKKG